MHIPDVDDEWSYIYKKKIVQVTPTAVVIVVGQIE